MAQYTSDPGLGDGPDQMSVSLGVTVLLALAAYALIRVFWAQPRSGTRLGRVDDPEGSAKIGEKPG